MLWYFNAKGRTLLVDRKWIRQRWLFRPRSPQLSMQPKTPKKLPRQYETSRCEMPAGSTVNRAKGHHGNEIVTMVFTIRNAKNVEGFLRNIWNGLSQLDRTEVHSSLTSRIDNAGTLFLRIDKQEALKGRIRLQETDPIKIAISFRTMSPKGVGFVNNIQKRLEEIQRRNRSDF